MSSVFPWVLPWAAGPVPVEVQERGLLDFIRFQKSVMVVGWSGLHIGDFTLGSCAVSKDLRFRAIFSPRKLSAGRFGDFWRTFEQLRQISGEMELAKEHLFLISLISLFIWFSKVVVVFLYSIVFLCSVSCNSCLF